ncbi:MAG: hypothetical protein U1F52_16750 [Burkholderiales bacterium]
MTIGFARLKGEGAALPPRASWRAIALAWLGGCLAIGTVAGLADGLSMTLVLGSFGASCVLVLVALVYNNATRPAAYPKYW